MRWQSGGCIAIETLSFGREVRDLNQSPQIAMARAATTARNVATAPAAVPIAVIQSVGPGAMTKTKIMREPNSCPYYHLMPDADQNQPDDERQPADNRGRVTFLDPKNMTDEEIEDALAFINEGMPES